jgi:hypothetical protein
MTRDRSGRVALHFKSKHFRLGISQQMLQQIALGGTMIALPIYLQVALVVPILAALVGWLNSVRMLRLPDPESSGSVEGLALG